MASEISIPNKISEAYKSVGSTSSNIVDASIKSLSLRESKANSEINHSGSGKKIKEEYAMDNSNNSNINNNNLLINNNDIPSSNNSFKALDKENKDTGLFSSLSNKLFNLFNNSNNNNNQNQNNPSSIPNNVNNKNNTNKMNSESSNRINNDNNINNINNINSNSENSLLISNKNLRGSNNNKKDSEASQKEAPNSSQENKSEPLNIPKLFRNHANIVSAFNGLDNRKKMLVEKAIKKEISSIIKEFIPHFANFNYDISEAIDLLVDLSTRFKLEKEKINFYVTFLNSNFYTIKNKSAIITGKGELTIQQNSLKKNKIKDPKIDCLLSCLNFLDDRSKLGLLGVNKTISIKHRKKIYFKILKNAEKQNNLPNSLRLGLWKQILDVVSCLSLTLFILSHFILLPRKYLKVFFIFVKYFIIIKIIYLS